MLRSRPDPCWDCLLWSPHCRRWPPALWDEEAQPTWGHGKGIFFFLAQSNSTPSSPNKIYSLTFVVLLQPHKGFVFNIQDMIISSISALHFKQETTTNSQHPRTDQTLNWQIAAVWDQYFLNSKRLFYVPAPDHMGAVSELGTCLRLASAWRQRGEWAQHCFQQSQLQQHPALSSSKHAFSPKASLSELSNMCGCFFGVCVSKAVKLKRIFKNR